MTENRKGSSPKNYDWAQAWFDLADSNSSDLNNLALAANLDPKAGDLSHIDLSDLNIEGQDLSGWNLEYAELKNTRVARCNFRGAKIRPAQLAAALDWQNAELDETLRAQTEEASVIAILEGPVYAFLFSLGHQDEIEMRSVPDSSNIRMRLPSPNAQRQYQFGPDLSVITFFQAIYNNEEFPFSNKLAESLLLRFEELLRSVKSHKEYRKFIRRVISWLRHGIRDLAVEKIRDIKSSKVTALSLKKFLDRNFGPDRRMNDFSYLATANTIKRLGFKNIAQLKNAISGIDDRAVSRTANDGGISGQCYRLEEVLQMLLGDQYPTRLWGTNGKSNFYFENYVRPKLKKLADAGFAVGSYKGP